MLIPISSLSPSPHHPPTTLLSPLCSDIVDALSVIYP